ncbi:B-cell receptor CD22-like [Anguilla anguilla]|uniref:B-cell receptor CD22-like n=1 Tax=Anguilla anguilla TaxID=7936 RepID=UPI0015B3059E|nr:B-cell receptor CD22-like [Anguilla anguilla]
MISFWAMVLLLIGDSACSFSKKTAKEGSCVTVHVTLYNIRRPGYIVWLKDAVWNEKAKDYEGTIVHSLKPDKHNASEFENRVSVGSTESTRGLMNYELTINNLRPQDSGKYSVRYYGEDPSYKMNSLTMSLDVQENPCQVSVTGPELVQTGAEVILRCSTVGRCQNSPEWRSSGSGLASSEGSDTQGVKTAQLSFKADWSHDGVTFSCWPSPGNDACASRNITLAVEYSPKDTEAKVAGYDIIKEGQAVTFSCHSKGNPQPTLSLFKLGQGEIAQGGEWKLPNVKIEDAGSYFCQAKNKLGTENSTNVMLDVKYAPKKVRITTSGTLEGIYEGAAVSLTCEVQSSNPSVRSYSWYRDHTTLLETSPVLRFPAVRPEDRGSYRCQASNSAGSGDSPEVTITVRYGPRGTKIKASCCQGGVKVGESLTLTCETDARPEPSGYTWFRTITEPGRQRGPGRTEVAVPSNGWSDGRDLRFRRISAGDAGEYMCQAKNTISAQNSTTLPVYVLYGPTDLTLSMDSEARESSLVTIHCSVESFPLSELTLTWAPPSSDRLSDLPRHPKRLQGNYTDQPTRTSLAASFIASVEHAGWYTCRASNSEGLKESTKELVVHYAPKDVRATANPRGEVTEKTDLDLSCEARSNPNVTAYTWFKLTGREEREVGKGRVLTLRYLSEVHTGQYFCRTRNKIGEGNSRAIDVTVRYGPRKPVVVHNMTSRGQPVKESAVALMCRSQSYPPIQSYMWHVQKDVNVETLPRATQNLTISSDEEGTYYCSAENEISSSSSDSIEIRFDRSSTRTLIMATSCFFVVVIILVIVIVILLYRKRRKSARQRLENGSRSDTWETLVMDGMGGPQRSRETLSTVMAPPPGPPANQHGHDSELYASPHTVNSPLKFPEKTKQAKSSGLPHRDGGGPAEEDGINYASLQFPGKGNRIDPKPEETECVYSKLAKPIRKQEVEAEEAEYENVKEAVPRWTERESDSDSETSDEDPDVCYTTVSFAPQAGPPGPRGAHCQGDSDTSDEDDYKSQYSNVKA